MTDPEVTGYGNNPVRFDRNTSCFVFVATGDLVTEIIDEAAAVITVNDIAKDCTRCCAEDWGEDGRDIQLPLMPTGHFKMNIKVHVKRPETHFHPRKEGDHSMPRLKDDAPEELDLGNLHSQQCIRVVRQALVGCAYAGIQQVPEVAVHGCWGGYDPHPFRRDQRALCGAFKVEVYPLGRASTIQDDSNTW